jgi:predicted 2-oxoglutarate/Fe(II)-dependent dioxygenase YbiX
VVDDFLSPAEIAHIRALSEDTEWLAALEIPTHQGHAGFHFEMPVPGDPVLERIAGRLQRLTGLCNRLGATMRFRRYQPGEGHRPHLDAYTFEDLRLVLTAMMWLEAPRRGGETVFPKAPGGQLTVTPRAGGLALWASLQYDGKPDPETEHLGATVLEGEKVTLTAFIWRPEARRISSLGRSEPPARS